MKTLLLFVAAFLAASHANAFSCAVASSTTPLLSSASASWTSCNGTVPQNGDSVTVGFPLKIDSNIPASGSVTAFSVNGSTATITWDGNPHKVTVAGQIVLTLGCVAAGTGCAAPFIIDTCTQAASTANATGSAGSASTALTVSGVSGTIQNGMMVTGAGIVPGTTVTGSGTSWTLSQNSYAAVSGKVYFSAVMNWTATGLSANQAVFNASAPSSPFSVFAQVCNFLISPSTSGSVLTDAGQFGVTDSSTFLFRNGVIVGGAKSFIGGYEGALTLNNVTQTGSSDSIYNTANANSSITTTATGSAASKTITVNLSGSGTYGAAVGQIVTGTNIPANTTVASFVIYPGTSVTLSNFPTGTVTSATFRQVATATNVTQVNSTSDAPAFFSPVGSPYLTIDSEAILSDAAGTHAPALTQVGNSIGNSLLLSYYQNGGMIAQQGISLGGSSATFPGVATGNAVSGAYQGLATVSNSTSNGNFFSCISTLCTAGQGLLFGFGYGCPFSSSHDVAITYLDPGNAGILTLNNTDGVTASSPCPVFDHLTLVMGLAVPPSPQAIGFGEDTGLQKLSDANASIHDSIVIGSYAGIQSRDSTTTWLTNGTGSAGVYNNDVFGQSGCAYSGPSTCVAGAVGSGFDNGVTAHPNALYGDVTFNPNFQATVQFSAIDTPWISCDTKLGGTGSVANMFQTVMGGRAVSGYASAYTPAQVVSCLRAPFAPTNPLAATAGSTGSFIGAMAPAAAGGIHHKATMP